MEREGLIRASAFRAYATPPPHPPQQNGAAGGAVPISVSLQQQHTDQEQHARGFTVVRQRATTPVFNQPLLYPIQAQQALLASTAPPGASAIHGARLFKLQLSRAGGVPAANSNGDSNSDATTVNNFTPHATNNDIGSSIQKNDASRDNSKEEHEQNEQEHRHERTTKHTTDGVIVNDDDNDDDDDQHNDQQSHQKKASMVSMQQEHRQQDSVRPPPPSTAMTTTTTVATTAAQITHPHVFRHVPVLLMPTATSFKAPLLQQGQTFHLPMGTPFGNGVVPVLSQAAAACQGQAPQTHPLVAAQMAALPMRTDVNTLGQQQQHCGISMQGNRHGRASIAIGKLRDSLGEINDNLDADISPKDSNTSNSALKKNKKNERGTQNAASNHIEDSDDDAATKKPNDKSNVVIQASNNNTGASTQLADRAMSDTAPKTTTASIGPSPPPGAHVVDAINDSADSPDPKKAKRKRRATDGAETTKKRSGSGSKKAAAAAGNPAWSGYKGVTFHRHTQKWEAHSTSHTISRLLLCELHMYVCLSVYLCVCVREREILRSCA